MLTTRGRLFGAVVAATAAILALGAGPAQAAPDGSGKEPVRSAAAPGAAPDAGARAAVVTSRAAEKAVATLQKRIADYVAKNGTAYSFASYLDGTTGRIVLTTDAPAPLVASLTSTTGFSADEARAFTGMQLHYDTVTDQAGRRDDTPPFWGGAGLLASNSLCSAGYVVQNSAGTRFMVTAGHCYAAGVSVAVESGARTIGVVSNRRLPTVSGHAQDMELLGGQSYGTRVYTGGVTSTSSLPVVGAGEAVVGFTDYCHSGRTTGENCGHTATSITAQTCTQTGCKSPVVAYQGGNLQQGGDSGGTFYVKDASNIWVRGHVISSGGGTAYVQGWPAVQAAYGVSIVTG